MLLIHMVATGYELWRFIGYGYNVCQLFRDMISLVCWWKANKDEQFKDLSLLGQFLLNAFDASHPVVHDCYYLYSTVLLLFNSTGLS